MREKFNILLEDDQKMYNKWVKGIAKQEGPSHVITVDDVVNRYRNTASHEAIQQLPYGLDFLVNQVGDIFSKCAMVRMDCANAMKNPVIYDHTNKIDAVKNINDKMGKIQDILFSCTEDMNKIVENSEKDDKL
jgi:hypothetical protein